MELQQLALQFRSMASSEVKATRVFEGDVRRCVLVLLSQEYRQRLGRELRHDSNPQVLPGLRPTVPPNRNPVAANGEPSFEFVGQRIVEILRMPISAEDAAERTLELLETVSGENPAPERDYVAQLANLGEIGLMQMFQMSPILKPARANNGRLIDFIRAFLRYHAQDVAQQPLKSWKPYPREPFDIVLTPISAAWRKPLEEELPAVLTLWVEGGFRTESLENALRRFLNDKALYGLMFPGITVTDRVSASWDLAGDWAASVNAAFQSTPADHEPPTNSSFAFSDRGVTEQAGGNPQSEWERQELNVSPESLIASFEEEPKGRQSKVRTSIQVIRGQICVQIKEEIRRVRFMARESGLNVKDIMVATPQFKIWEISKSESLAIEDREILLHPNQWETGYAGLLLRKYFGVSAVTIRDYITAYNKTNPAKNPS